MITGEFDEVRRELKLESLVPEREGLEFVQDGQESSQVAGRVAGGLASLGAIYLGSRSLHKFLEDGADESSAYVLAATSLLLLYGGVRAFVDSVRAQSNSNL